MTTSTQSSCEPQLLIPFKVTRSAFASGLLNLLEENDFTPVDIFEQISFAKALKIFVPMYKFEGSYSGTWKCSVERSAQSLRRDPQNRYKIKNGKTSGKFSVLCRACSGDDLPEALLEFTRVRKYPGARTFSQEELEQGRNRRARILTADATPDQVWHETGLPEVEELANEESLRMAPDDRNFECSANIRLSEKGTCTLVPFWYVEYTYKDQPFYYIREGFSEEDDFNALPADEEIMATHERLRKQKRNRYFMSGLAIPLILAALTALFMPGLWLPLSVAAVGELFFFYIWSRYFAYSFDNYDAESPYAQQNRALREASAASVLDKIRRAEKRLG